MTLEAIFYKPVDRTIEGVIKADDEQSLRIELDEYVLTNEVEKRLEHFLDAYNNYEGANGVWISGFFGSGKSHLLKILALLLENREIDGASALELFLPKCGDNEILRGDLKRAVDIPSKSILFNIDQKADVISKTQIDALLAVFVKVFDESCGYYGKQGHIAQFERDLDSRGHYRDFKTAYENISGRTWHKGREQALLETKNIAKAYAQVTSEDETAASGILDRYRNEYRVSIEDFADRVNAFIDSQGPNFRLNFFVDEVGQYIADNIKLMTNLQTIAESLATKSRGRAWVIVTAQEEMSTVVGELGKQQSNDFSKIQARFKNRMKLTSQDVAEVIQKRLLTKNDQGIALLSDVYHAQSNNFKTLFDFADGAQTYRNFQDRDHFIHSYPFIPYQFALFQSVIQNLSEHNAFEGKHSSVGERSMLGVFQQVAIQIGQHEVGQLATFDLMFEGIRTALKAMIQRSILLAENQLNEPFAVQLLKALFLVKYVKGFKSTVRNLCVLMLEGFDHDLPVLRKKVEQALNLLEQQTYIQRNGDTYEFLTDEEKDVEQEIKNTEVETSDVAAELESVIFDHVIKHKKIRYDENGQDYSFSRKLDDRLYGREQELTIHVISPFNENFGSEDILRMQSMGRDEMLVLMPADERLMRDILMYKRTEKYIRQNISTTQQDMVKRILNDKGHQNQERLMDIRQRVKLLLGKSKIIIAGGDVENATEDAQTRVVRGFDELITRTYPNLRMLRGVTYREDMIGTILEDKNGTLLGNDTTALAESEQELLAFIQANNRSGLRSSVKSVLEKFGRKPYGWYYAAVLCTLANLCTRGKVEVRVDGNLLADNEIERNLRNTHAQGNILLEPQVEFSASQVRALKEFYEDFFDAPPSATEAKALAQEAIEAMRDVNGELELLMQRSPIYPFLVALQPVITRLKDTAAKPYNWFLEELPREEDELLDLKEQTIDPIRKFMGGSQKEIYDEVRAFVGANEANFSYLPAIETDSIKAALNDTNCYKGTRIQGLKGTLDNLKSEMEQKLKQVREQATDKLKTLQARIHGEQEYQGFPEERQAELDVPFSELVKFVAEQRLIAVINDRMRYFEEEGYQKVLDLMDRMNVPKPPPGKIEDEGEDPNDPPEVVEVKPDYVYSKNIDVAFDKAWLGSNEDIDRYLDSLREALLDELRKGKRIRV